MANKTIFELNAVGSLVGTMVFPIDDGVETFKCTFDELVAFLNAPTIIEDDTNWDVAALTVTYTSIPGAKNKLWQFRRTSADDLIIPTAAIDFPSSTSVRVSFELPPGAGTYTLIGK